ncbi:MAG TPA: FAD-binding oxidoreductase [Candidatus Saccharimonadales bacterium]|nr:FAD-binding oxidoreductase [Candidatus Saccharimonadales bacterium]
MDEFKKKLVASGFAGELADDAATKEFYSHDASLFEIKPQLVVSPKDTKDVQTLVTLVAKEKKNIPDLSVTARSAGTDMSGGAVNDSIIVDFNKHLTTIKDISPTLGHAQPGVFYRDFEAETLKQKALMPSYPASRSLCTIGGMVANNSGGEKSLEYGKVQDFVEELSVVLGDGKEYVVKPLTKDQLIKKMAQGDYEGDLYKNLFKLIEANMETIQNARPKVSKNSMGYNLWDVWNPETGIFNLNKLIVGSQGTLGLVTDIKFRLVPARPHSGLLVLFLKDIDKLGELINVVLKHKPATFESFDDATLWLSIKFMPYFLKMLGPKAFIKLLIGLIPDGLMLLKGIPKLVLMVEFNGETAEEVQEKITALHKELKIKRAYYEISAEEEDPTEMSSEKFWVMRRQSFQLLRSKVKDKHTAPFIDDLIVNPEHLPEFLPRLRKIIKKYELFATIAGHMGDGNFHIIPLMKLENQSEKDKILPAMEEIDDLVLHYGGSLSGEHNDGLVRGPWLKEQFGEEVLNLFKETKKIFDPQNIFNPHKKADADWDYSYQHIRDHF